MKDFESGHCEGFHLHHHAGLVQGGHLATNDGIPHPAGLVKENASIDLDANEDVTADLKDGNDFRTEKAESEGIFSKYVHPKKRTRASSSDAFTILTFNRFSSLENESGLDLFISDGKTQSTKSKYIKTKNSEPINQFNSKPNRKGWKTIRQRNSNWSETKTKKKERKIK